MSQASSRFLKADTSRALLIKKEDSYRPENYGDKDFDLYAFITGEIGSADGVSSWLYHIDHLVDSFRSGNSGILARYGDKIYITNIFDPEEFDNWKLEETEICMSVDAARRLFVQIERLFVEMPEHAEIIWHEDGSATIEWQPTSIRQVAVQELEGRYYILDKRLAQKGDCFFEQLLNIVLDLIRNEVQETMMWFYNPVPEPISVGTFTFKDKIVSNREEIVIIEDSATGYAISLSLDLFRLISEHATRIINEKPSQITLKWYKHGAAFEWERDCNVTNK